VCLFNVEISHLLAPSPSCHKPQQQCGEIIFLRLVLAGPKAHEIRVHGGIGDQSEHIGKGRTGAAFDVMAALRVGHDPISVPAIEQKCKDLVTASAVHA